MAAQSTDPIWTPSQARIDGSNIARYLQFLRDEYSLKFAHYQQLHQWSINNTAIFLELVSALFQTQRQLQP